ncbi:MAG TPA: hypothetical protein VKV29_11915, partial [Chthonomonas sp.]|uniref:hypothetical protein n=1 Tax=Chthonomonas sp. TaxID=2282153 RepID=UPI002B4B85B3
APLHRTPDPTNHLVYAKHLNRHEIGLKQLTESTMILHIKQGARLYHPSSGQRRRAVLTLVPVRMPNAFAL